MNLNQKILISNPEVIFRKNKDGHALLFNPSSGQVLRINAPGIDIWKKLERKTDIDQIVSAIAKQLNTDPSLIETDIVLFMEELLDKGFIGIVML